MSDCKCKQPCGPCNNNCPDDGEIIESTVLDPEDCNTNCCWKKCSDNCWINIQSTNDCLVVDTSECWVIKLTAECPKPTYVKAWNNITVRDVTPPSDCYIDWWDCSVKGWWEISSTDEKVKACGWDSAPGYLRDKLQPWTWIKISSVWCDWTDSKVKISIDEDILPDCPTIPSITIDDSGSKLIRAIPNWHHITITDKEQTNYYYAKLVLWANKDFSKQWNDCWETVRDSTWTRKPVWSESQWAKLSFNKNLAVDDSAWVIGITKSWLYHIWFSGSMELNYWVHAFRMQLYRWILSDKKTMLECRWSAPLWWELWQDVLANVWKIRAVTWVSGWWESEVTPSYWEWKLSYPLVWFTTEANWQQWHSQSMWASLDRVPVCWSTIVELKKWDVLYPWVKYSTSISHSWMLNNIPHIDWQLTLLWADWSDWDNWWECWFSFFVDLIHPINN